MVEGKKHMSAATVKDRSQVKLASNPTVDNELPKRNSLPNPEEIPVTKTHGTHSKVPSLHRNDLQIKMLMIGNVCKQLEILCWFLLIFTHAAVGKTNVMMRFAKGRFSPQYSQTIGLDFQLKSTKIEDKKIQIQVRR